MELLPGDLIFFLDMLTSSKINVIPSNRRMISKFTREYEIPNIDTNC